MMGKLSSIIRGRAARIGLWVLGRMGLVDKIGGTLAGRTDFFRNYLAAQLEKVSNEDLDRMIADCEAGNFGNEYVARIYTILKSSGLDTLQELKNEKFLREHRKKHEKLP